MTRVHTGANVKKHFQPLSEADIRALSDEASFRKGYDAYLSHAIVEPTLSASVLRAFCHGSSGNSYRVEVTLLPTGETSGHKLASAACSCPRGGFCKHLIALLLTWLYQPERFVLRTGLLGRLSEKSREELLALLEQLLQRQPDIAPLLEVLLELPLGSTPPGKQRPGRGREPTLDPATIESQVASAFYNAGDGWDAAGRIAPELDRLCDLGKSFAEAGQWANAQVVYAAVAEETMVQYEGVHDEGQIGWVLGACAAGLVACLEAQSVLPRSERLEALEREALLATLFDLWKFGNQYGGTEVGIPTAIAAQATVGERKRMEAALREELRPGQEFSSRWHNRSIVDFLVLLKQADQCSEEDILEEYRQASLYKELAEHYLRFDRAKEALDVAHMHLTEPMDVTWFAGQLLQVDEAWRERALALVEARLQESEQALQSQAQDFTRAQSIDTYRRWLSEKYLLYGKIQHALDIERARFQAHPDEATYRSVRSTAQAPGQPEEVWPDLRPELIRTLEQQGRWGALITVYLDEGAVSQALAALAELERPQRTSLSAYGYHVEAPLSRYQAQVAAAAEESYPEEAIRLYKRVVQWLIDGRGRANYQQAVGYLDRVRQLYQQQKREPAWQAYITDVRTSNKSLRALKEELDKRGL
jgi:hypothetical protein